MIISLQIFIQLTSGNAQGVPSRTITGDDERLGEQDKEEEEEKEEVQELTAKDVMAWRSNGRMIHWNNGNFPLCIFNSEVLVQYSIYPLFQLSTVPIIHCSNYPLFQYSIYPLFQLSTVPIIHLSTIPIIHCSNYPIIYCCNYPLFQLSTIPIIHCSNYPIIYCSNFYYNIIWSHPIDSKCIVIQLLWEIYDLQFSSLSCRIHQYFLVCL